VRGGGGGGGGGRGGGVWGGGPVLGKAPDVWTSDEAEL
jgi:hypothetical protein